MFDNILNFFRKLTKSNKKEERSKDSAKERLHLVLMQDRANVSADFLDLMKQEIIEVIKKYIDVDEKEIDVRLTNKTNDDGTNGAPILYANIPIVSIKDEKKNTMEKPKEQLQEQPQEIKTEEEKQEETVSEVVEEVKKEAIEQIEEACEIVEEEQAKEEEKQKQEENNEENKTEENNKEEKKVEQENS